MRLTLPLGVALLALTGCRNTVIGPDGPGPPAQNVSFAADIQPLLAARCTPCHITTTTSGVRLSTHPDVLGSTGDQYGEAVVRPGDAAGSPLVDKVEAAPRFGSRMPLGEPPLSSDEIAQVRAWIDAGALDN